MTAAVALPSDNKPTVYQFVQSMRGEIARALPKGMDADRVARLALTVVRQDPALQRCKPESFAGALLTAAALGLEPGVNQEAYLVAYRQECTLIVGYQGYAKLFYQHPLAQSLNAHIVYENDTFDYEYGTSPFVKHKPARGERGKVTHYYAAATLTSGASHFVVLTADEVKALRNGQVGTKGVPDPQHWMERKTAIRQLIKLLPKSTSLAAAAAADEQTGTVLTERTVATAINDGAVPALPPATMTEAEWADGADQ